MVLQTKNILDVSKLKHKNQNLFNFYIDKDKTNDNEYPHVEYDQENNRLSLFHVNSVLFNDYLSSEFRKNWNLIFVTGKNQDVEPFNSYTLINHPQFFSLTYSGDDVLSHIEGSTIWLFFAKLISWSKKNRNLQIEKTLSQEQKDNLDAIDNFVEIIHTRDINKSSSYGMTIALPLYNGNNVSLIIQNSGFADRKRFEYKYKSQTLTRLIDRFSQVRPRTIYYNLVDQQTVVSKNSIFIPYEVFKTLESAVSIVMHYFSTQYIAYSELKDFGISDKNINILKEAGFTGLVRIIPEKKRVTSGTKVFNVDRGVILREENYRNELLNLFIHILIPECYKNKYSYSHEDTTNRYVERRVERECIFHNPNVNRYCDAIVDFKYTSSNFVNLSSKKLQESLAESIKNEILSRAEMTTTIGSLTKTFDTDLSSDALLIEDFKFTENLKNATLPNKKSDPYQKLHSQSYFMYFDLGDGISYPNDPNITSSKIMNLFSFSNYKSHSIKNKNGVGKDEYVSVQNKSSNLSTYLNSSVTVKEFNFEIIDTKGKPFTQIKDINNENLPLANIIISVGYKNYLDMIKIERQNKIPIHTQYTFVHDNGEFPTKYTPLHFNELRSIFSSNWNLINFDKQYANISLISVNLPTQSTLNSEETSQYFVCVNGCTQANTIEINKDKYYVVGILNISKIYGEWEYLKAQNSRYLFSLETSLNENISIPFMVDDIQQINNSSFFILNSKKEIVDYTRNPNGTLKTNPPTPIFIFKIEVFDKNENKQQI